MRTHASRAACSFCLSASLPDCSLPSIPVDSHPLKTERKSYLVVELGPLIGVVGVAGIMSGCQNEIRRKNVFILIVPLGDWAKYFKMTCPGRDEGVRHRDNDGSQKCPKSFRIVTERPEEADRLLKARGCR